MGRTLKCLGRLLVLGVSCLHSIALNAQPETRQETFIGDALAWYSVWMTDEARPQEIQRCQGELRGNAYQIRCDSLAVVLSINSDRSGNCAITNMSHSLFPQDGLRVGVLTGTSPTSPTRKPGCAELSRKEGAFNFQVNLHFGGVSTKLSTEARDAALAYFKTSGGQQCLLRFPAVRTGDPFFHVYQECEGHLEVVWEFTISQGRAANFSHWQYTRRNLPEGADKRRQQSELWFGVSKQ